MPQKKKEPNCIDKPVGEVQADHELFLQAFEKPTQIYRYLRTRNIISPIFLHRNLYYMKNRMSRNHKNRSPFKINSLIDKVEKNELKASNPVEREGELAKLEVHVIKICHKKRKEASAPTTQVCVGTHDVKINPCSKSDGDVHSKPPAVTIPTQTFGGNNGHQVKSYVLQFRVELLHDQENVCEPSSKRRKLSKGGSSSDAGEEAVYKAELVVYDRHGRCQLTPGSYELVLHPLNGTSINGQFPPSSPPPHSNRAIMGSSPRKSATWETAEDLKVETTNFTNFQNSKPILQFSLSWSQENSGSEVALVNSNGHGVTGGSGGGDFGTFIRPKQPLSIILANSSSTKPNPEGVCSPEAPQLVLYQFIYNNNGRQQTEARRDFHCPWCSINCLALYCLLKHLKLCHSRFSFTYVPHPKGAKIDVSLNDCYDGSYAGNPQDLVWLSGNGGAMFSRAGPVRRSPVTALLVCRPRRVKPSLSEFLVQDLGDFDLPRSYILGHNRLYHHTMTCRPIGAHELDEDSEGEHDSLWMRSKTVAMIDDFSDVNEGEKEIMKLWNVHVMRHNFVADIQLPTACSKFVEAHGKEVLERNLYRNYLLHLVSLFEFGVIGAGAVYNNIAQLQAMMKKDDVLISKVNTLWCEQRSNAPKAMISPTKSEREDTKPFAEEAIDSIKTLFSSQKFYSSASKNGDVNTEPSSSKSLQVNSSLPIQNGNDKSTNSKINVINKSVNVTPKFSKNIARVSTSNSVCPRTTTPKSTLPSSKGSNVIDPRSIPSTSSKVNPSSVTNSLGSSPSVSTTVTASKSANTAMPSPSVSKHLTAGKTNSQSAKSVTQSSKSAIPASKSTTPAAKTLTPSTKSMTPATKSLTTAIKTLTPSTKTLTPATKSTTPATKTLTPASKSSTQATKSTTPATKSLTTAIKTLTPSTKSTTPATKSLTTAIKALTPSTKSTTPATKSLTTAIKALTPSTKSTTPATKSLTTAIKTLTPSTKSTTPATKTPSTKSTTPATKSTTPATKSTTPATKTPSTKSTTPATKSTTPSTKSLLSTNKSITIKSLGSSTNCISPISKSVSLANKSLISSSKSTTTPISKVSATASHTKIGLQAAISSKVPNVNTKDNACSNTIIASKQTNGGVGLTCPVTNEVSSIYMNGSKTTASVIPMEQD